MKRQRNTAQMMEQTTNIEVQIKEEEIGKLSEKEFSLLQGKNSTFLEAWEKVCFLKLRRHCGVSHEVRRGAQGASCVAPSFDSLLH